MYESKKNLNWLSFNKTLNDLDKFVTKNFLLEITKEDHSYVNEILF